MVQRLAVGRLLRVMRWIGVGLAALVALGGLYLLIVWATLPPIDLPHAGDPGETAFMKEASCPDGVARTWVDLDDIDPRLGCAMILAEDASFFRHDGVDWQAARAAARTNWGARRILYGASTLPMQLARNLYLTRGRSLTRKLREVLLARRLVDRYDRLRLLEVYLNSAELAPCVYGAEAGARHHFGHGAATLDLAEATLLAALLPRPSRAPGFDDADRRRLRDKQKKLIGVLQAGGLLAARDAYAARHQIDSRWASGWRRHAADALAPAPARWYERECGTARFRQPQ